MFKKKENIRELSNIVAPLRFALRRSLLESEMLTITSQGNDP